jgi:regulator of replication initiation timing
MNEQDFQNKLGELMQQIGELPTDQRERLEQMAGEARDRHNRMKKTITDLQDSLDYLRLSVKYIMFDLEATRRENAYLRKLLEKSAEGHDDGNGAD